MNKNWRNNKQFAEQYEYVQPFYPKSYVTNQKKGSLIEGNDFKKMRNKNYVFYSKNFFYNQKTENLQKQIYDGNFNYFHKKKSYVNNYKPNEQQNQYNDEFFFLQSTQKDMGDKRKKIYKISNSINKFESKSNKDDNLSKNLDIYNKGRKSSISSLNISSDDGKQSNTTMNTSISSIKEKDVFSEKKFLESNDESENEEFILNIENAEELKDKPKTEVKKYEINKNLENTEILCVNVKLAKDKTAIFKLKGFDYIFYTIKLFCEINSLDEKFIKPLIIKSLCTINTIYQIYNCQLSSENISLLKNIMSKQEDKH